MCIGEAQKRADVVLVEPQRLGRMEPAPFRLRLPGRLEAPLRRRSEGVIKGIEAVAMLARSAPALSRDELHVDGAGQPRGAGRLEFGGGKFARTSLSR